MYVDTKMCGSRAAIVPFGVNLHLLINEYAQALVRKCIIKYFLERQIMIIFISVSSVADPNGVQLVRSKPLHVPRF